MIAMIWQIGEALGRFFREMRIRSRERTVLRWMDEECRCGWDDHNDPAVIERMLYGDNIAYPEPGGPVRLKILSHFRSTTGMNVQ